MVKTGIAIISTLGMLIWFISGYYAGLFIYFLAYFYIVFPLLLLYVFSVFETLYSLFRTGWKASKIKFICHATFLLTIGVLHLVNSEVFKSKRVLVATLKDDLYHYELVFRENGTVENTIHGMLGYTERFEGTYLMKGDTLFFTKVPYKNDFIPETLLMDKTQNMLFIEKDQNGQFIRKKAFLNHLEINFDVSNP